MQSQLDGAEKLTKGSQSLEQTDLSLQAKLYRTRTVATKTAPRRVELACFFGGRLTCEESSISLFVYGRTRLIRHRNRARERFLYCGTLAARRPLAVLHLR